MTDRELINSINSDLVFLKQKCENCMELRGWAAECVESIRFFSALNK